MAESGKITREDIIAKDAFTSAVVEAKQLLDVLNQIQDALKTKAKKTSEGFAIASPQSIDDVKKLTAQIAELQLQIAALEKVQTKQKQAKKELTEAEVAETLARQQANAAVKDKVKATAAEVDSLQKLRAENLLLIKQRDQLGDRNGKNKAQFEELTKKIKLNTDELKKANEAIGNYRDSVGNYEKAFSKLPNAFNNAIDSAKSFGSTLLQIVKSPIAYGIGGIASAVLGLGAAFKGTREGGKEIKLLLTEVEAIGNVLKQRVADLALGFFHLFTDPKKAAEDFSAAFASITGEISLATEAAVTYAKAIGEIKRVETAYISERAKNELLRSQLLFKSKDQRLSVEERKKALEEVLKIGKEEADFNSKQAEKIYAAELALAARKSKINQNAIIAEQKKNEDLIKERKNAQLTLDAIDSGRSTAGRLGLSQSQVDEKRRFLRDTEGIIEESNKKIAQLTLDAQNRTKKLVEGTDADALAARKKDAELDRAFRANLTADEIQSLEEKYAAISLRQKDFFDENRRAESALTGFEKAEQEKRAKQRQDALDKKVKSNEAANKKIQEDADKMAKHNLEEWEKEVKRLNDLIKQKEKDAKEEADMLQELVDETDKIYNEQGEDEKKRLEDLAQEKINQERKVQQQILKGVEDGIAKRSDKIQNGLEKEIQKQNDAVAKQEELAAKGLDNTLAYQEKKREELQAKLQREQEAERKREEALQLAGAFLGSYQSRLDKNQSSTAALAGALADTLIAKAISSTIAGAFAEGVENFQGKGTGTSDSNLIAFSHGESVVTAKATQKYSGLVTAMNSGSVEDYVKEMILPDMDAPMKVNGNSFQSAAIIYTLNTKLESLEKAIKNKQEVKINWNAHGERVEEVVKDGMKTVIKHVTTGKRRL